MNDTTIRGFRGFDSRQLKKLCNDYALSLSEAKLSYCIRYYKNAEHRDPLAEELQLLSALSASLDRLPDADCIYDFSTEDAFIAQTYADMVQKRKLLNPGSTFPMTLAEAAHLATKELARIGKYTPSYELPFLQESTDTLQVSETLSCETADGRVRLSSPNSDLTKAVKGDALVLLKDTDGIRADFSPVPIKTSFRIGKEGLLLPLLRHFEGLLIDLRPFSNAAVTAPLTVLTDERLAKDFVLHISSEHTKALLTHIRETGGTCFVIGYVTEDNRISFYRAPKSSVSLESGFLRSLYQRKKRSFRVGNDTADSASEIRNLSASAESCSYLAKTQKSDESVARLGEFLTSAANAYPLSECFKTALCTAISPILALAASGIPADNQSFAFSLSYSSREAALETLLGLYRVQTELAIPAHEIRLSPTESSENQALTVFSFGKRTGRSASSASSDSAFYLLELGAPTADSDFFDMLREKLTMLRLLSVSGAIRSFRVLLNESVQSALAKMRGIRIELDTSAKTDASQLLPLALLLESTQELSLPIVARAASAKSKSADFLPAPKESLIPSERPEIVILCDGNDPNARALASAFRLRGAHVSLFAKTTDLVSLTRTVLGAHALILCDKATLPEDPRFSFALDTMKRAGGSVLSTEESDDPTVHSFPAGISVDVFEALCATFSKN